MKRVILQYFIEVNVQYPKELRELRTNLPFLSERIKN